MANVSQTVARVYGQALYEVAAEQGVVGRVLDELRALAGLAWKPGNEDIRDFLLSPRIDRDHKWRVLEEILGPRVSRPVLGLIKVLIYKGRETTLDNIVDHFERFRDLAENRIHAHVTVAESLGDEALASIKARLEASSGKIVNLHERVDPSVIGGASLRVGDRVIDRTLRTKLAALRKSLLASTTN
jgi:F-type H+-transporting ATPase subunit delta